MAKNTSIDKKKKIWVSIAAPKEFRGSEIGETYVEEPVSCIGKFLECNLMLLTNDSKKQSTNLRFRINEYKNNVLYTELVGLRIQVAQLKRITRKQKDKIEDSFVCITKDNIKIRLKPILVTKTKVTNSKLTSLRKNVRDLVSGIAKNSSYSQLMMNIINNDIQKHIRNNVSKILPIANCIIKAAGREN